MNNKKLIFLETMNHSTNRLESLSKKSFNSAVSLCFLLVLFSGQTLLGAENFGDVVIYANNSATLIGNVTINGEAATTDDTVAIYVGDELRSKQKITSVFAGVAYVNALVNCKGGEETVTFKVHDASADAVIQVPDGSATISIVHNLKSSFT